SRGALGDHAAVVDEPYPPAVAFGPREVVGGDEQPAPDRDEALEVAPHEGGGPRVEPAVGLVEHEHERVVHHRRDELQLAPHPVRVLHDLALEAVADAEQGAQRVGAFAVVAATQVIVQPQVLAPGEDRKSTRLNSSHVKTSYAV